MRDQIGVDLADQARLPGSAVQAGQLQGDWTGRAALSGGF
jgi:hypothetical protein